MATRIATTYGYQYISGLKPSMHFCPTLFPIFSINKLTYLPHTIDRSVRFFEQVLLNSHFRPTRSRYNSYMFG